MPPRPLHRWKSFWLGILILSFLGWAWTDSMRQESILFWAAPSRVALSATQTSGVIGISWTFTTPPVTQHFHYRRQPISVRERHTWFPKGLAYENDGYASYAGFAHWFLIILFLSPWCTFIAWKSRRQRPPATPLDNLSHPT